MTKRLITECVRQAVVSVPAEDRRRRLADLDHPIVRAEDEDDEESCESGPES
jgi:hypothetical protein